MVSGAGVEEVVGVVDVGGVYVADVVRVTTCVTVGGGAGVVEEGTSPGESS